MLNEKFKLSVIIPTYNRCRNLEYTIRSLVDQNIAREDFEIIVADDGSDDDTFKMVKQFTDIVNFKYVYQVDDGYRPASARNLGITASEGNICLFIDSGIILKKDCLLQHINCHAEKQDDVAIIGYTYGYTQHGETEEELMNLVDPNDAEKSMATLVARKRFLDIREKIYRRYDDRLDGLHAAWSLFWGGHLSVKRKTLYEVGMFDENYDGNWGCEDNDLGYRLQRADCRLFFCRQAAVLHLPHGTNLDLKKKEGYTNCQYFHQKFQTDETKIFLDHYLREITGHEVIDFNEVVSKHRKSVASGVY
ncbi:MAG: glycosyltransferase, partial [Cytophagales bacterium]|nr:glycosyltransferase [Cytophagales bacterium]